jgi:hypothetical protein
MSDLNEHIRRLDSVKTRYDRGDSLYGREAVGALLEEIAVLSERCLQARPQPLLPLGAGKAAKAVDTGRMASVQRCDALARKGTGEGECGSPMSERGYCPKWRDHLEED